MRMSAIMGRGRKIQGDRKELKMGIGVIEVHKRRRARMKVETLTRHTANIFHLDVRLSVGFGKRNDLLSQFREDDGHAPQNGKRKTPSHVRHSKDEFGNA